MLLHSTLKGVLCPCVQEIGLQLQPEGLQSARQVCRHWRQHITRRVEACLKGCMQELDLLRDVRQWKGMLSAVEAFLPRIHGVKVGCPPLSSSHGSTTATGTAFPLTAPGDISQAAIANLGRGLEDVRASRVHIATVVHNN
jgi:hypothetical protein